MSEIDKDRFDKLARGLLKEANTEPRIDDWNEDWERDLDKLLTAQEEPSWTIPLIVLSAVFALGVLVGWLI